MNKSRYAIWYLAADFLSAVIAWLLLYYSFNSEPFFSGSLSIAGQAVSSVLAGLFWCLLYAFRGAYSDVLRKSRIRELFYSLIITLAAILVMFLALLALHDWEDADRYYQTMSTYLGMQAIITLLMKAAMMTVTKKLIRDQLLWFNTLIIGSSQSALEIYNDIINNHETLGCRFIGYLYINTEASSFTNKLEPLGSYLDAASVIRNYHVEQVIIAIEPSEHKLIENILTQMDGSSLKVSIIPDVYHILIGSVKVQHVFGAPFIDIKKNLMPVWQRVIKRGLDIGIALIMLVLGLPFFILFALLTKLSSPGPVIYSQERIGRHGKPFRIFKFRSMYTNSEDKGPALSSLKDSRITPWGRFMRKTRLDETPQFYNVLMGDMSLVGPRPERSYYIDQIMTHAPHYKHLQKVRPGITSLGQVKFGYAENVDQMVRRLKYDIIYIENMSLFMDFRILIYTILTLLQVRGR
jgi:exopolysaccharide biosynthesis polyprenyl glycosylphosphotransferase